MQATPKKLEDNTSEKNEITPEKLPTDSDKKDQNIKNESTPSKKIKEIESKFKTPEKSSVVNQSTEYDVHENGVVPEKSAENVGLKTEPLASCDVEDGLISTTEQARLLMAASRTPSKSVNKTPVKQSTPSGKRSLENSPATPGKHRRVELITLASPKAKRLKQI